jgi:predicted enzyme related to lactoylglutathione lyase
MNVKYVHTNIIAKDWEKVSLFYQRVFGCKPISQRDLSGDWVDRLTGINNVHIVGEHLVLPGYDKSLPTLEIFSYNNTRDENSKFINRVGLAHLAFEVDDIEAVLQKIKQEGGGQLGEIVRMNYSDNVIASFVYAKDIEGNLLELQNFNI